MNLRQIFDPENFFWRTVSRCVDFVGLGLFWTALCLPVLTAGPATAALYQTVVLCFRHGEDGAFGRMWRAFRENLRQGIPLSLLAAALAALIGVGYAVMSDNISTGLGVVLYMIYYVLLVLPVGWICWLFPLMGRFSMSSRDLMRTAALLTLRHLPSTFVVVLLTVQLAVFTLEYWWPVFFTPVLCSLLTSLFFERIFLKYLDGQQRTLFDPKLPAEAGGENGGGPGDGEGLPSEERTE